MIKTKATKKGLSPIYEAYKPYDESTAIPGSMLYVKMKDKSKVISLAELVTPTVDDSNQEQYTINSNNIVLPERKYYADVSKFLIRPEVLLSIGNNTISNIKNDKNLLKLLQNKGELNDEDQVFVKLDNGTTVELEHSVYEKTDTDYKSLDSGSNSNNMRFVKTKGGIYIGFNELLFRTSKVENSNSPTNKDKLNISRERLVLVKHNSSDVSLRPEILLNPDDSSEFNGNNQRLLSLLKGEKVDGSVYIKQNNAIVEIEPTSLYVKQNAYGSDDALSDSFYYASSANKGGITIVGKDGLPKAEEKSLLVRKDGVVPPAYKELPKERVIETLINGNSYTVDEENNGMISTTFSSGQGQSATKEYFRNQKIRLTEGEFIAESTEDKTKRTVGYLRHDVKIHFEGKLVSRTRSKFEINVDGKIIVFNYHTNGEKFSGVSIYSKTNPNKRIIFTTDNQVADGERRKNVFHINEILKPTQENDMIKFNFLLGNGVNNAEFTNQVEVGRKNKFHNILFGQTEGKPFLGNEVVGFRDFAGNEFKFGKKLFGILPLNTTGEKRIEGLELFEPSRIFNDKNEVVADIIQTSKFDDSDKCEAIEIKKEIEEKVKKILDEINKIKAEIAGLKNRENSAEDIAKLGELTAKYNEQIGKLKKLKENGFKFPQEIIEEFRRNPFDTFFVENGLPNKVYNIDVDDKVTLTNTLPFEDTESKAITDILGKQKFQYGKNIFGNPKLTVKLDENLSEKSSDLFTWGDWFFKNCFGESVFSLIALPVFFPISMALFTASASVWLVNQVKTKSKQFELNHMTVESYQKKFVKNLEREVKNDLKKAIKEKNESLKRAEKEIGYEINKASEEKKKSLELAEKAGNIEEKREEIQAKYNERVKEITSQKEKIQAKHEENVAKIISKLNYASSGIIEAKCDAKTKKGSAENYIAWVKMKDEIKRKKHRESELSKEELEHRISQINKKFEEDKKELEKNKGVEAYKEIYHSRMKALETERNTKIIELKKGGPLSVSDLKKTTKYKLASPEERKKMRKEAKSGRKNIVSNTSITSVEVRGFSEKEIEEKTKKICEKAGVPLSDCSKRTVDIIKGKIRGILDAETKDNTKQKIEKAIRFGEHVNDVNKEVQNTTQKNAEKGLDELAKIASKDIPAKTSNSEPDANATTNTSVKNPATQNATQTNPNANPNATQNATQKSNVNPNAKQNANPNAKQKSTPNTNKTPSALTH